MTDSDAQASAGAPPAAPGRALGFSVSAVLGDPAQGDPNIVLQTHWDQDTPLIEIDRRVDVIMDVVARQQARAEVERIKQHIRNIDGMLRGMATERQNILAAHGVETMRIGQLISAAKEKPAKFRAEDEQAWDGLSRNGPYKPSHALTQRIDAVKKEVGQLEEQMAAADAQLQDNLAGLDRKRQSWLDDQQNARENIARLNLIIDRHYLDG